MLIKQVLDFIHNYFIREAYSDTFEIKNGSLTLDFLLEGQYFMIKGSVLNDGVYKYPSANLSDEKFEGIVYGLAIPKDVLDLVAEIEEWQTNNASALLSPFQSESFGGYSYSKVSSAGGKDGGSGAALTWRDVFGSRLNAYRKLS